MVGLRIVIVQKAATPVATTPPASPPTRSELSEQIRQTILDATQAAQKAGDAARITVDQHGVIVAPEPPNIPTVYVNGRNAGDVIPPQAVDMAIGFFVMCAVMVIGWPIARAFGKRIERRGQTATLDAATSGQLQRIEQAVDAMSIEIERISESQRFMAKLQSNSATVNANALPMERR